MSLHTELFTIIENSINTYQQILNQYNISNKVTKSNIKILNNINSFKNQNYFELIDRLKYIKPKEITKNNLDYETDSTTCSMYSDISDF